MIQTIERIVRDRISELELLEQNERSRRMKISYQDKRDELHALLLRFQVLATSQGVGPSASNAQG